MNNTDENQNQINQNNNRPTSKNPEPGNSVVPANPVRPAPEKPAPNNKSIPFKKTNITDDSPADHTRTFDTNQTAKINPGRRARPAQSIRPVRSLDENDGENNDGTYSLTGRNIKSSRQRIKNSVIDGDAGVYVSDKNKNKTKSKSGGEAAVYASGFVVSGILKVILYIVGVILISVILSYYIITIANDVFAFKKDAVKVNVIIPENATISKISQILRDKELIEYPWVFDLYMTFKQNKQLKQENAKPWEFEPGIYSVSTAMNYDEFISAFRKKAAAREVVRITIPEGYTTDQIIVLFLNAGLGNSAKGFADVINNEDFSQYYRFLIPLYDNKENISKDRKYMLDGYLFPDTYDFYTDESELNIIIRLLDNFNAKFTSEYTNKAKILNMTIDDMVNLASVVQREGLHPEDMPKIAAVFHNRLLDPATYPLLESDATILYSYGKIVYCDTKQWHFENDNGEEITIDCAECLANKPKVDSYGKTVYDSDGNPVIEGCGWRNMYSYRWIRPDLSVLDPKTSYLTQDELKGTDLPYNSYMRRGLLPGAICNPGIESLFASFWPEEDFPYYFFVTDMNGKALFARTLTEHNNNRAQVANERLAAAQ